MKGGGQKWAKSSVHTMYTATHVFVKFMFFSIRTLTLLFGTWFSFRAPHLVYLDRVFQKAQWKFLYRHGAQSGRIAYKKPIVLN